MRLFGNLPPAALRRVAQREPKAEFTHLVTNHTMVHEQMQFFLRGFAVMRTPWPS
jgi:hypothetical protein